MKNNKGFTIVELIIATSVFSTILIVIMFSFMYISHAYIKGSVNSLTQETARNVLKEISQQIELSNSSPNQSSSGDDVIICVGNTQYHAYLNSEIGNPNGNGKALIEGTCPTGSNTLNKELLSNKMRVGNISVSKSGVSGNLWHISLLIGYGDDASLHPVKDQNNNTYTYTCDTSVFTGTYCSVVTLSTDVQQKIGSLE